MPVLSQPGLPCVVRASSRMVGDGDEDDDDDDDEYNTRGQRERMREGSSFSHEQGPFA